MLETGSTQLIRTTAAQQLADVQKQHPDELFNLLTRVIPFLRSRSWDTRIAAAKAVGGIVENAEKFDPNQDDGTGAIKSGELEDPAAVDVGPLSDDQLQLETLDISAILNHGKKLLGSAGKQYDYSLAQLDPSARLAYQKKTLTARLGLGGEYTEEDLLEENDFVAQNGRSPSFAVPRIDTTKVQASRQNSLQSGSPYTATTPLGALSQNPFDESGLSKRQLNQLKRKAKANAKNQASKVRVVDLAIRRPSIDANSAVEPHAMKSEIKTEEDAEEGPELFSLNRGEVDEDAKIVSEFKGANVPEKSTIQTEAEEQGLEWPYERLCDILMVDLFDHNWEIRHGAAIGLREVIRVHGAGAGRLYGKSRPQNEALNTRWLDDLACRLCCVLMLDRFGDYVSDNVVAPIRETVGQTLGALLVHLPAMSTSHVYRILYRMVMQEDLGITRRVWEVCHGGMIGLRYLVAVRNNLLSKDQALVDGVIEAVMKGLADGDDDVRAVSAATLTPIAQQFVNLRPKAVDNMMTIIWDCLSDIRDDLSASTGSVMDLLAKLCSFPAVLTAMENTAREDPEYSFTLLVPRLYPFLRHTITSVRSAVLRALQTFLRHGGDTNSGWVDGRILRLIFQNLILERNESVLNLSLEVWMDLSDALMGKGKRRFEAEFIPHAGAIFKLALHPIGVLRHPLPICPSDLLRPSGQTYGPPQPTLGRPRRRSSPLRTGEPALKHRKRTEKKDDPPAVTNSVDGPMIQGDVDLVGFDTLTRSRVYASRALGKALSFCSGDSISSDLVNKLSGTGGRIHSTTQITAALIVEEYARASDYLTNSLETFTKYLRRLLESDLPVSYPDLVSYLQIVRAQCHSLLNCFRDQGHVPQSRLPTIAVVVQGEAEAGPNAFSLEHADGVVGSDFERLKKSLPPAQRITSIQLLTEARASAVEAITEAKRVKNERDCRIRAVLSSAIVAIGILAARSDPSTDTSLIEACTVPKKPSLVIKGLMDSVKTEELGDLQRRSSRSVASLIGYYAFNGERRGPADKILANLMKFYCTDTSETPEFRPNASLRDTVLSLRKEEDRKDHQDAINWEIEAKAARITRRGAKEAIDHLTYIFKDDLLRKAPNIKSQIEAPLHEALDKALPQYIMEENSKLGQDVIDGLSILRTLVGPGLPPDLHALTVGLLPLISKALTCELSVFRYAAAKCFATICSNLVEGMTMLVQGVLPRSSDPVNLHARQGAIECIYHLIHVMEDGILPYVIFLIVPVLGRMSDSDHDIRLIATTTFATLVKLVPLEAGIPDPPGLSEELLKGRDRERKFIAQMLDPKKVEPFEIPVAIKAELRSYQQEGVNWLAFLNRFHLHGILCDDMGLGKTLQTLCVIASDHHIRAEEFAKSHALDMRRLPSLIVCPPTLSGHWQQEIQTYAPFLSCLAYVGIPSERSRLRKQLGRTDIVITSYDVCRNDIDILLPFNWNYCVLDEGHLIKNPKAKTTLAVKRLLSNHRLILSGTPIQNNVLELWSLFDFLMPGFLGTEKVFQDRFAKPIANSRFSKSSSKEQEAGALAVEALHKQVLPFLLRRLKEEVLNDLPPKILQNYYCDLSDLQKRLFEDFTKKERKTLSEKAGSDDKEAKQHIFQALQYMRKLCNSPALVVKEGHKQYASIQKHLAAQHSSLRDISHAPKLSALRDLLVDCGIGVSAPNSSTAGDLPMESNYVSQHRALIFCQTKEMLDMVQQDVLRQLLPSVQYLRLDGNVEASKRQNIVNQFNTDPSYDVLLLTTSVGGLGLNLTGADTVIFVEHDWNPQRDLQAMDRAHRLGQKKVVNVYRLVTRGTVEEKILK